MIILHGILFLWTLVLFIFAVHAITKNSAGSGYNITIVLLFLVVLYSCITFITFIRFRAFIIIIPFIAAFLLLVIPSWFISYFMLCVECRYSKENLFLNINVESEDCTRIEKPDNRPVYNCSAVVPCKIECGPLPLFWTVITSENAPGVLLPLTIIYCIYLFLVLVLTLWMSVIEKYFCRCVNRMDDVLGPTAVHAELKSDTLTEDKESSPQDFSEENVHTEPQESTGTSV